MSIGIFITGTDTDVGKTLVTGGLLRALISRGTDALPVKPVQSGCGEENGQRISPDLKFALRVAGLDLPQEALDRLCGVKLSAAYSPHLAAELEDRSIDWATLTQALDHPDLQNKFLVVEGAGGLLVPITRDHSMLDLAEAYDLPVLLVARATIGTLNHTLLSVEALRARNRLPLAIILSAHDPDEDAVLIEDNIKTLRELTGIPVLGPLPYLPDLDTQSGSLPDLPPAFMDTMTELADTFIRRL